MIIKLSDYILEQSISDASINDIELEQLVAEMDVCCKLAMAYNKQLLMDSYFQEATTPEQAPATNPTQPAAQPTQAQSNQTATPPKVDVIQHTNSMSQNIINPNKTDTEGGFFKTILGYIKRFFRWIGLKLSGMSEDAYKNIQFIERYVMNATEQDLYAFIQKHKINIELYNPDKITAMVNNIYKATSKLRDQLKTVKNAKLDSRFTNKSKLINHFDTAIKQFSESIQQTEMTESNDINDKVNQLQLFKQYIQGYADMVTNRKRNNEFKFVKALTYCGNIFVSLQTTIDEILSNEVYSSDDATAAQLKPMLTNLQTSIKQASTKINSVVNAYTELKQFAVDISKKLQTNPNDMNRGQIEKKWVNQQQ